LYKKEPTLTPESISPVSALNVPLKVKPPATRSSTYFFDAASVSALGV